GFPIDEYVWNLGTRSRPNNVYIYYSRLDVGANRVNLAIIARRMASEVFVIDSGSAVLTSRPAIGIQIDNDAFFSIHALSSGGSDSLRLIRNIFEFFNTPERQHINWMAVGDFNRSPGRMQEALNEEPGLSNATLIVAPTEPTHRSGNVLDYAVLHNANQTTQNTT
ncbi:cytolethal distending toxin subunit B family protein, partial [Glaesserella parasuis]|nr:cytolethal distending toxin subunit B family protein [Glaesserella parasuis]MDO9914575.1 cytolethal distending toxin subunit B family protein [Glaesserella parasuis]MDP0351838.1 cytolethal distending toxin subunit B family protein [Glaesserella parasuis]